MVWLTFLEMKLTLNHANPINHGILYYRRLSFNRGRIFQKAFRKQHRHILRYPSLRRGVRGSQYAFVNSKRLQDKLNEFGIKYRHILALAPTPEIRESQKKADTQTGELKRNRDKLGQVFIKTYKENILEKFDLKLFIDELTEIDAKKVVFFCVEEKPEACHRKLVTDQLEKLGYKITHL